MPEWHAIQDQAQVLDLTLLAMGVPIANSLEWLFAAITQERPDELYVLAIPFPVTYKQEIADSVAVRGGRPYPPQCPLFAGTGQLQERQALMGSQEGRCA